MHRHDQTGVSAAPACAISALAQAVHAPCSLLLPPSPFEALSPLSHLLSQPPSTRASLAEIQAASGRRGRAEGWSWPTWLATPCRTGRTCAPPTCRVRRGSLPRCALRSWQAHRRGRKPAARCSRPLLPLRPFSPSRYMTRACCRAQESARGKLCRPAPAAVEMEARTGRARTAVSEWAPRAQLRSERSNERRGVMPPPTCSTSPPRTCFPSGGRLLGQRAKGACAARRGSCETSGWCSRATAARASCRPSFPWAWLPMPSTLFPSSHRFLSRSARAAA